jgi:hypothetical protein
MKRLSVTLLVLACCLVVVSGSVLAQDVPTISNLEIALWPEFDRPEVLVIYQGSFSPDTPLPIPVEIRIPAGVGQPTAVAYVSDDGQRLNQEYTTRVDGDWLVVAFQLATRSFQLEYYDTLPVDAAGQRAYTFTYTADYPITALSLEFQVPPTASGFTLDPPADSVISETDGLNYHVVQAGSLAQGETGDWTFTYQKDNADLTASAFAQPETPVPPAAQPSAGDGDSTVLIFLVAFVGLVAVGGMAFWLGRRTQSDETESRPPQRQRRRGSGRGGQPQPRPRSASGRDEAFFCHQCGAQLRPDADFCHKCGAVVREI